MKPKKLRQLRRKNWAKRKQRAMNSVLFVLVATVIQVRDDAFEQQVVTFCSKIGGYTVILGLNPAKVAAVIADQKLYSYILLLHDLFFTFSQDLTTYKRLLRHGIEEQVLGAIPVIPTAPIPVPPVTFANMQKRFADLVQDCVRSSNFSSAIGEDLGIIAPSTPFDPQSGKPIIKFSYSSGGHPLLIWKKGKFEGVNIYKNDGTGYRKFDFDSKPDYIDKSDLPEADKSAVWKYKLIYVFNDAEVGSFSEEVAVTVYGSV
jgi:hypothetical protein